MNFAFFRRIGAILTLTTLVVAPGHAAETATISAGTVNVRGRAGFIGEIVTKLNRGDKVTILDDVKLNNPKAGEPADWLKIALPANTPVWLYASFIDPATQTVKASKLKVRGGPGINYSVLGFLEKGTAIKEIRRSGEWMEIQPPEGLGAYIAANLVTRESAAPATEAVANPVPATTNPAAETPEAAPPNTVTPAVTTEPAPEEPKVAESKSEVPTGADIGAPAPITPPPTTEPAPAETTAISPAITTPPPTSTTIVAEPAPAIAIQSTNADRALTPEERASQVLEQRTRDSQHWEVPIDQDDVLLKKLPEHRREVVRDGRIRRAMSIQAPGDYELAHIGTGLRLNYLYTTATNIPLKELLGVKVRIKGEEGIDPRWPGTPVLLIKSLEVLP